MISSDGQAEPAGGLVREGLMKTASDVLTFWLEELTEKDWYAGGEALDATIRARFAATWVAARDGALTDWLADPQGALAYLIVTDQLSRNMHRGTANAFATDTLAHAAANRSVHIGWDRHFAGPEQQFFYLPFMHSETLVDQSRSVGFFTMRHADGGGDNLLHARAHREVIRKFGRFPTRNAALGRTNTAAEAAYLVGGGYGAVVKALQG